MTIGSLVTVFLIGLVVSVAIGLTRSFNCRKDEGAGYCKVSKLEDRKD